jgi:hypothetical protein
MPPALGLVEFFRGGGGGQVVSARGHGARSAILMLASALMYW